MRMTVLKPFHDRDNFSFIYKEGQVAEFDKERADRLLQLGLAIETVDEPKAEPETEEVGKAEPEEEKVKEMATEESVEKPLLVVEEQKTKKSGKK